MKRMTTFILLFLGFASLTILLVSPIASAHTYAPPSPPQQLSDDVPNTPVPFPCPPDPAFPFNTTNESEIHDPAALGKEGMPVITVNPMNTHVIDVFWMQDRGRAIYGAESLDGGASWLAKAVPGQTSCDRFVFFTTPNASYDLMGNLYVGSQVDWDNLSSVDTQVFFLPTGEVIDRFDTEGKVGEGNIGRGLDLVSRFEDIVQLGPLGNDNYGSMTVAAVPATGGQVLVAAFPHYRFNDTGGLFNNFLRNPQGIIGAFFGTPVYLMVNRSLDNGLTWEIPKDVYGPPGAGNTDIGQPQAAVLPNGNVVIAFEEQLGPAQADSGFPSDINLSLLYSADQGQQWLPHGQAIRGNKRVPIRIVDPDNSLIFALPSPLRFAADPKSGKLYEVWTDGRFGPAAIAYSESTDGGFAWTAPVKINQTPNNGKAFNSAVAVTTDGTVVVVYMDFRNNTPDPGLTTDLWALHCHASCTDPASWHNEVRVTPNGFDLEQSFQRPLPDGTIRLNPGIPSMTSAGNDVLVVWQMPHLTGGGVGPDLDRGSIFFTKLTPVP